MVLMNGSLVLYAEAVTQGALREVKVLHPVITSSK
jgi:hypothetical protein